MAAAPSPPGAAAGPAGATPTARRASTIVGADADKAGGAFSNTYATPGWQRAQANRTEATDRNWGTRSGHQVERIGYGETDSRLRRRPHLGQGAHHRGRARRQDRVSDTPSPFTIGDRVFHQKFGNGNIAAIEGNKLTIDFDKAGQKKVLDGFVQPA